MLGLLFFFLHVGGTEKRGQSASDVTNTTVCVCVQTRTHTLHLIYTHTHTHTLLVGQSEVAFSRAFSLISAQMSENFPEFRLTDYTTPKEQNFKGGTRKFAMFSEFNGPNIKIYSFFFYWHTRRQASTETFWETLNHFKVCVCVGRQGCVCVCVWVHSLDSWAAFVIVRVLRLVSVFKKN